MAVATKLPVGACARFARSAARARFRRCAAACMAFALALLACADAHAALKVKSSKTPIFVTVPVSDRTVFFNSDLPEHTEWIYNQSVVIANALPVNDDRVIAIKLSGLPLQFGQLSASQKASLKSEFGSALDSAGEYERAVALRLRAIMDNVRNLDANAMLTVYGLPIENPSNPAAAKTINKRYDPVIDRSSAFVLSKKFVMSGGAAAELSKFKQACPEAVRLAGPRSTLFRTNNIWRRATRAAGDIAQGTPSLPTPMDPLIPPSDENYDDGLPSPWDSFPREVPPGEEESGEPPIDVEPLPIMPHTGPRVMVLHETSANVKAEYPQYDAIDAVAIYQGAIDPGDVGRFTSPEIMAAELDVFVPSLEYTGLIMLNWEGQGMHNLMQPIGSPQHTEAIIEFVKCAQFVKQQRPLARIGFYNVPVNTYYDRDQDWRAHAYSYRPILDVTDCVMISVYDFYTNQDNAGVFALADLEYVRDNVKLALEVADGKPVYPVVWHRWHDSNPNKWMRLIPHATEFRNHVKAATDVECDGQRIDGIVWWSSDKHMRWLTQQNLEPSDPEYIYAQKCKTVFNQEIPAGTSDATHFNNIARRYLENLRAAIDSLY